MKYSDEVRAAFLSRGTVANARSRAFPITRFAALRPACRGNAKRRTQTTAFDSELVASESVDR